MAQKVSVQSCTMIYAKSSPEIPKSLAAERVPSAVLAVGQVSAIRLSPRDFVPAHKSQARGIVDNWEVESPTEFRRP